MKKKQSFSRKPESDSRRRRGYSQVDMRLPTFLVTGEALILLVSYMLLCFKLDASYHVPAGLIFIGFYVCSAGAVLLFWSLFYGRVKSAEAQAEAMNTEIYDVFRYIIDVPYAVVSTDGRVKVVNGALQDILGLPGATCNMALSDFCNIPVKRLMEQARNASAFLQDYTYSNPPEAAQNSMTTRLGDGRQYEIMSYIMRLRGENYYFLLFRDVDDYLELYRRSQLEQPVVCYIALDNLQELSQFIQVNYRDATNKIEALLGEWAHNLHALLREYDRDKYMVLMSNEQLEYCIRNRFDILDKVMAIRIGDNSFPVSISMGISATGESMEQRSRSAYTALEVALQRGGNQVALRRGQNSQLEYFGGTHKTMEANTSVSSRVAGQLLAERIREASNILVMGHANPDFDAIGACVGVARLAMCVLAEHAEEEGRTPDFGNLHIVTNTVCENFRICREQLAGLPEYEGMFVNRDAGLDLVRSNTLLVIVDVNNQKIFEAPDIPFKVSEIALIDHHILVNELAFTPFLHYIETTKSSTCEIVAEMLEQSPWNAMLKKEEANVMLSGIMLDTNHFTRNAGSQTFAIAHYLYTRGAHTAVVREFFDEDLEKMQVISDFESRARLYRRNIAITWLSSHRAPSPDDRIAASRAADKLLALKGVEAAFALVLSANRTVIISGRSKGDINVQIILEKLEGGGHFDMAGAQIRESTLSGACDLLKAAIDNYFEYDYRKEENQE